MRFQDTTLEGAWLTEPEKHEDERGFFARGRCSREFREHGLAERFVQTNFSHNHCRGTFRGLHYQVPPSREGKLVRCTRGAIRDVIVDLRPASGSFLRHEWIELAEDRLLALYVPPGIAHGFLTASDNATVMYEMSDYYAPELARGIRWNDPLLDIVLPGELKVIHPRDAAYPDLIVEQLGCFDGAVERARP